MKKLTSIILTLLVLLICTSTVMAEDTKGIYVGVLGGYVIPNDAHANMTAVGNPLYEYDASMKNGYLLGAKVGWLTPFTKRIMAVEFEYNHLQSSFEIAKNLLAPSLTSDLDGNVKTDLFMFNIIARYPKGIFHPYIGAGAGYAMIKVDDHTVSMSGSPIFVLGGGDQNVFAYQLMAGFDVDVTQNIIISVGYKYIDPRKISYDSNIDGSAPPGIFQEDMKFKFHAITLGISYLF